MSLRASRRNKLTGRRYRNRLDRQVTASPYVTHWNGFRGFSRILQLNGVTESTQYDYFTHNLTTTSRGNNSYFCPVPKIAQKNRLRSDYLYRQLVAGKVPNGTVIIRQSQLSLLLTWNRQSNRQLSNNPGTNLHSETLPNNLKISSERRLLTTARRRFKVISQFDRHKHPLFPSVQLYLLPAWRILDFPDIYFRAAGRLIF